PVGVQVICRNMTARTRMAQAEDDLRRSEQFNAALIAQSPLAIVTYTPDGYLTSVNQAWEQIWGLRWEQIQGYNLLADPQLLHTPVRDALARLVRQGGDLPAVEFEYDSGVTSRGGHRRWVAAKFYTLQDAGGQVTQLVCVAEDITERKRAED